MRDKFYYQNSKGEKVQLGDGGIYINQNNMRGYSWAYDSSNGRITDLKKGIKTFTLPVVFLADTPEQTVKIRDAAYKVFEYDVKVGKMGTIICGGYELRAFVIAAENTDYISSKRMIKTTFTLATDEPYWTKKATYEFFKVSGSSEGGIDFPFDFAFDYGKSLVGGSYINNDTGFPCDFNVTIYGPCVNPSVSIGGHIYAINGILANGERVEIDSLAKKVTYYSSMNVPQNWFRKRAKEESVFEAIPAGISKIQWSGAFGFRIVLLDRRSEPEWYVIG